MFEIFSIINFICTLKFQNYYLKSFIKLKTFGQRIKA